MYGYRGIEDCIVRYYNVACNFHGLEVGGVRPLIGQRGKQVAHATKSSNIFSLLFSHYSRSFSYTHLKVLVIRAVIDSQAMTSGRF